MSESRGAVYTARRVGVASAAFATPSIALVIGEQVANHGGSVLNSWPIGVGSSGRIAEDVALAAVAAVVGVVAARKANSMVAQHDVASAGLTKRVTKITTRSAGLRE